jgi:mono/diheme cytochrome c family protein
VMRGLRTPAAILVLVTLSCAKGRERERDATADGDRAATLVFEKDGAKVRTLSLAELAGKIPPESFRAYDPYYAREKGFRALPLVRVLQEGFGTDAGDLRAHDFVLRARDGYAVPLTGAKVTEAGAYIAFADLDAPGWEPIGPQRANPAPFYLVWRNAGQQSLDTHPRPWQLATVAIAPFEGTYPHVAPRGAREDAQRGFAIFRGQCIACHAINREGGRVGPELNVPQSIVEYRPEAQIRAYIRDPRTFRYGNMPAHPNLTDADLDGLLAYFRAMRDRKHDPEGASPGDAGSAKARVE